MEESPFILVYSAMWGAPVEPLDPGSCRISTDRGDFDRADVVVFHLPTLRKERPAKRPGQIWVGWTMECDVNYPRQADPAVMSQFDLTMTYHLDADVPTTYLCYYRDDGGIEGRLRTSPQSKEVGSLVSMSISSQMNQSGRLEYAAELMKYLDVHSYGKQLRNQSPPDPDLGRSTKLERVASYKFDLSFENAVGEDYVTEKFFDPLVVGTVPVYLGAPNIEQFAPGDRCFINVADFSGPQELAEYLLYLDRNDAAYGEYFAWKQRAFRPEFLMVMRAESKTAFTRLCELVRNRNTLASASPE